MTADVELLPLPKHSGKATDIFGQKTKLYSDVQMQDYARANVEHRTGILEAKMETWKAKAMFHVELSEALRAEVAEWKRVATAQAELHGDAEARAERLAEALRMMVEMVEMDGFGKGAAMDTARAALHPTITQENDDV